MIVSHFLGHHNTQQSNTGLRFNHRYSTKNDDTITLTTQ